MSKDPAFLFYPGDYLRDTQCLSEKTQVAYDRIMCEHMRNICIRHEQVNFFTKRLSEDEKSELFCLLEKEGEAYFIPWVRESIIKRREYSASRRKNRQKKEGTHEEDMKTYVEHMENANAIVNEDLNIKKEDSEKFETEIKNPVGFQEPKKPSNAKKDITYSPDYEKIWIEYERKGSKSEGFNEYKKVKHLFSLEEFLRAVQFYKQQEPNEKFRKDIERFFKHRLFEGFLEKIDRNIAPAKSIEEEIRAIKEEKKVLSDKYPIGVLPSEEDRKRSRELNLRLHALEGGKHEQ